MKGLDGQPELAQANDLLDSELAKVYSRLYGPIHLEQLYGKIAGDQMLDWDQIFEKKEAWSLFRTFFAWTMVWHKREESLKIRRAKLLEEIKCLGWSKYFAKKVSVLDIHHSALMGASRVTSDPPAEAQNLAPKDWYGFEPLDKDL